MSYSLIPYVVDITQLKSIVGSKDESVVKAVVGVASAECDEDDDEDQIDADLEEAIFQLVTGQETDEVDAYQLGYALQEICEYAGTRPPVSEWSGVRWSAIEACGLKELLTKTGPPIDLPASSDFPRIGHIRREAVADHRLKARARFQEIPQTDLRELFQEYISWLETAAAEGLDIVFFYY
jgi:hypothetical protein